MLFGRLKHQTRLRFSAVAVIPVIVVAHVDLIYRQSACEEAVYFLYRCGGLLPASHVRLIGYHDQQESVPFEVREAFCGAGNQPQFRQTRWRMRSPVTKLDLI
jgi:hypothetical protein